MSSNTPTPAPSESPPSYTPTFSPTFSPTFVPAVSDTSKRSEIFLRFDSEKYYVSSRYSLICNNFTYEDSGSLLGTREATYEVEQNAECLMSIYGLSGDGGVRYEIKVNNVLIFEGDSNYGFYVDVEFFASISTDVQAYTSRDPSFSPYDGTVFNIYDDIVFDTYDDTVFDNGDNSGISAAGFFGGAIIFLFIILLGCYIINKINDDGIIINNNVAVTSTSHDADDIERARQASIEERLIIRKVLANNSNDDAKNSKRSIEFSERQSVVHDNSTTEQGETNSDNNNNPTITSASSGVMDGTESIAETLQSTNSTRRDINRPKRNFVIRAVANSLRSWTTISSDVETPTSCDICLMDYKEGEEVCWSPNEQCVHGFHKECIVDWLMTHSTCPSCRRDYLDIT